VLHAEARRARRLDHRRPHHGEGQPDTPCHTACVKAGEPASVSTEAWQWLPPPGSSTMWLTPTPCIGLAFAPGFAAQAGSFTPRRTHHHRSASLHQTAMGSACGLPSLRVAAVSANEDARAFLKYACARLCSCDRPPSRHTAHTTVCLRHIGGVEPFTRLWPARARAIDRLLSSHGRSGQRAHAPERCRNRRSCCPLPLHSLSSPLVTDRVMKHAHTRQDCWRRCANGDGERARDVRGGQPCFASSLSPTCPRCGLTVRGRRRQPAATSTLPAPSKPCTVT
jgi:hypothetical protein